jgi:ubiquinone biosynthesis protein UbiJ
VRLEISDWNIYFYLIPTHNGIELRPKIAGEADTTISGTLQNLFRIGIAKDKQHAIKQHSIQFRGDAHVGIAMQQILSNLDIDWEEHLSQLVGDTPASIISKGIGRAFNFGKDILESLHRNTSEYIHHEARLCPTSDELETFYKKIATLRNDVDRLEQKIVQASQKQGL